jgi:hypothetical protein
VPSPSRGTTRTRAAAALATLPLLALGIGYYLTYEPAPEVVITWREGTTWPRRIGLERRFGLVRGRDIADWTVWYDLVDVRPTNIKSLVEQPEVAATQGLDLRTHTIPPDGPYGKGWMWIGSRLPILRHRGTVPGVAIACAAVIGYAIAKEVRARRARLLGVIARLRPMRVTSRTRKP